MKSSHLNSVENLTLKSALKAKRGMYNGLVLLYKLNSPLLGFHSFPGVRLFQGVRLFFLPIFPGGTFIPDGTINSYLRVTKI